MCKQISNLFVELGNEKKDLAAALGKAAPGEKPSIAQMIKNIDKAIAAKKKELDACVIKNPYIPPPPPVANPCLPISNEIDKLRSALQKEIQAAVAELQFELRMASPSAKAALAKQIVKITNDIRKKSPTAQKIATKLAENEKCLLVSGGVLALGATFTGTAILTTSNADAAGPFKQPVTIGLYFSEWDHHKVDITSFPAISVTFNTPIGTVTTTISQAGTSMGTFNRVTKILSLSIKLFFHHSTILAGDSNYDVTLQNAKAMTGAGNIIVDGSAKFKDGYLDNETGWLTVEGKISPVP